MENESNHSETKAVIFSSLRGDSAINAPSRVCIVSGVQCVFYQTSGLLSSCTNFAQEKYLRGGACDSRYPTEQKTTVEGE